MRRSRFLVSILLTLAILFGMQFFVRNEVRADLAFPNVRLNGDILSWDPLPNLKGWYHIDFTSNDGGLAPGCGVSSTQCDLAFELDNYAVGTYTVKLYASDTSGNTYSWTGTYNFNKIELREVSNVTMDQASGYLTWQHDASNAPGAEIVFQVHITIDNY